MSRKGNEKAPPAMVDLMAALRASIEKAKAARAEAEDPIAAAEARGYQRAVARLRALAERFHPAGELGQTLRAAVSDLEAEATKGTTDHA